MQIEEYGSFVDREYISFFRKCFQMLGFNGISGDYLEFGSHKARTFPKAFLALAAATHCIPRHFWAYDSFCGLPESDVPEDEHPMWTTGRFCTDQQEFIRKCVEQGVSRESFTIVPGFFEDTIGENCAPQTTSPTDVALAFVDCDMYSSSRTVLQFLKPLLKNGMIIAFDDYYCYSDKRPSGERLALREFLSELPDIHLLEYGQFHWAGMSFIVEMSEK